MAEVIGSTTGTYEGDLDAFLAEAVEQRKGSWNPAYTAINVINWVRAGYDMAEVSL